MADSHEQKRRQLENLLQNPEVRLAGRAGLHKTIPSGFSDLDHLLQGGWPAAALTELFVDRYGGGELRLLLPALIDRLNDNPEGLIACVAPPYLPYAPAFSGSGLEPSHLLLVKAASDSEALWAMEQALQSGACIAVLGWVGKATLRCLRRLQLAAEQHNSWAIAFRPPQVSKQQSVAALRIRVTPVTSEAGLQLEVMKSRAGRPGRVCVRL